MTRRDPETGLVPACINGDAKTRFRTVRRYTGLKATRWICTLGPVVKVTPSIRYGMLRSGGNPATIYTTALWSSRFRIRKSTSPMPTGKTLRVPIRHGFAAMFPDTGMTAFGEPNSNRKPWAPKPSYSPKVLSTLGPAGYRVPEIIPLNFTQEDVESYTSEGVWLYIDSQRSKRAWYPYAGSRFSKMDASGKQIGILGYTEGASGLYTLSYAATVWSASLDFVQETSVGTSCNSDDLTITGYNSTGYRPEFIYEGPYARSFALAVRCVREDANGIVQ